MGVVRNTRPDRTPSTTIELTRWVPLGKKKKKRDVAAGIAILEEAGGLITTANPPEDPSTAKIEDVKLGSRLYLAIR